MPGFEKLLKRTPVFLLLLVLTACMPVAYHPGKPVAEQRLEKHRFVTPDGFSLPLRSWLPSSPPKAVIVALHGFNDYSNFFETPGMYFSRQGIACYAYDQRGFGRTSGRGFWYDDGTYARDAASFVAAVRKTHPGVPVYLLGESMGGAVAIAAMTGTEPPEVDGVILVAPAVWGRETMPWYQRWLLAVASHLLPWKELTGESVKVWPSDNIEMLRALGRDPLVIKGTRIDTVYGLTNLMDEALANAGKLKEPVLVQYGAKDQIIPKEPVLRMLGQMPGTTRKAFYRNGYHMLLRDLQGEQPMADIAAWLADHDAPLPHATESLNPAPPSKRPHVAETGRP